MRSYFFLEPAQIAEHYVNAKGGARKLPMTARALYADVQAYLRDHKMEHRLDEAAEIAECAYEIANQAIAQEVPLQPEARDAFRANIEGGTTASDAELASYVAGLSMQSYTAEREKLIGRQGTLAFLGGNDQ